MEQSDLKREAVFNAAAEVFARYGFKRTTLSDIANAAGISRPALYLMFQGKDDLFRQLAAYRQNEAIDTAIAELAQPGSIADRVAQAVLIYERLYYEPVRELPHGAELMDANISIAGDEMRRESRRFAGAIARAVEAANAAGEVQLARANLSASALVDLMMASVNGQKKAATSVADFRKKVAHVVSIFCASVAPGGKK